LVKLSYLLVFFCEFGDIIAQSFLMQASSQALSSIAPVADSEASLVFQSSDNVKFLIRASTAIADFKNPIPILKLRHATLFSSKLVSKFNVTSGDIFKEGSYPARVVTFGDLPTCANIYPNRVVAYGMGSGAVEVLVRRTAKQAVELTQAAVESVLSVGPIVTRDIVASANIPLLTEAIFRDPIVLFRAASMFPEECRYFPDVRPYMIVKIPLSRCSVMLFEAQPTLQVPSPHNAIFYNCSSRNDVLLSYAIVQQVLKPQAFLPPGAKLGYGIAFPGKRNGAMPRMNRSLGPAPILDSEDASGGYYSDEEEEEEEQHQAAGAVTATESISSAGQTTSSVAGSLGKRPRPSFSHLSDPDAVVDDDDDDETYEGEAAISTSATTTAAAASTASAISGPLPQKKGRGRPRKFPSV
jgi:hypothetical protein